MKLPQLTLSFTTLIQQYKKLQSSLQLQVQQLASNMSQATPGSFILIQFEMSQITQIGESISNLISQVNSVINHAVAQQQPR